MPAKFYITTAIPYVNARPHIGHALEFIQADILVRYHQVLGEKTLLLSGSDENALKNVWAAQEAGAEIQAFVDANAKLFQELAEALNVRFDVFQKGSDRERHFLSSRKLWKLCEGAGDIYKKSYEGLYCVGCEAFYTADELTENGECFEHPGRKLEKVSEENYFFRLSKYQSRLIELISSDTLAVIPKVRKNEMLSFLREPLRDISISRTNERAKNWGVPVPGDNSQRIYVWFDALNIYQSGIGFGWDEKMYQEWWPADLHVIGKGILRFHAVYWPAFLFSAGLKLPRSLLVHGYLTVGGRKMSKTLGNVLDPLELVELYGADALRYYLSREVPVFDDGDFTQEKFSKAYEGNLVNGLGNYVQRISTMARNYFNSRLEKPAEEEILKVPLKKGEMEYVSVPYFIEKVVFSEYKKAMDNLELNRAMDAVFGLLKELDGYVQHYEPFHLVKTDKERTRIILWNLAYGAVSLAWFLTPFLPETSDKIFNIFGVAEKQQSEWHTFVVKEHKALFPRKS